ncbi:MAG: TadE/TadG family type IV pilus assembly protein [Alphaproteobacteria bacterium]|nr:TadE/TadG family type IV pilus assembly protein [Alphaproteobacteria bacterium]
MRRWMRDTAGATAIEFAVVSGVFFMLMFGIIEYGMIMLTKVAIESATQQVGRSASIGNNVAGCANPVCSIKKIIADKTVGLVNPKSVIVTATVVSGATTGTPPTPDMCLADAANPFPATCPPGAPFQNNNGVAGYQLSAGLTAGSIGGAGDLVEIRVTYLWRVLFPLFRSQFGRNGVLTITSSTVVKNEPF